MSVLRAKLPHAGFSAHFKIHTDPSDGSRSLYNTGFGALGKTLFDAFALSEAAEPALLRKGPLPIGLTELQFIHDLCAVASRSLLRSLLFPSGRRRPPGAREKGRKKRPMLLLLLRCLLCVRRYHEKTNGPRRRWHPTMIRSTHRESIRSALTENYLVVFLCPWRSSGLPLLKARRRRASLPLRADDS